ncbi:MAG: hypothetical protein JNJ90_18480 [Saprospiraceae bacterium]|jgi:hypothetical protein|nr:hypothetical protein [Saprospiraceae bacterium]
MIPTVHKIKTLLWVAFQQDLSATEHSSLGDAIRVNPWLIFLEATGKEFNYQYANDAYGLEMYDGQGYKKDSVSMGDWLLSNVIIGFSMYAPIIVNFSLTDPLGHTESKEFGNYREGLRNALVFLRSASQYSSWADLKKNDPNEAYAAKMTELEGLQRENKRLQSDLAKSGERVAALEKEIEQLQAQIETIKSVVLPPATEGLEGEPPHPM